MEYMEKHNVCVGFFREAKHGIAKIILIAFTELSCTQVSTLSGQKEYYSAK